MKRPKIEDLDLRVKSLEICKNLTPDEIRFLSVLKDIQALKIYCDYQEKKIKELEEELQSAYRDRNYYQNKWKQALKTK